MFYNGMKEKALAERQKAVEEYNCVYETVQTEGERLYQTRKQTIELIESIEDFLKGRTNTPQEFAPTLARIDIARMQFRETEDYAAEYEKAAAASGIGVVADEAAGGAAEYEKAVVASGVGVVTGGAVAKIGPPVTKWFATTFGKASTGTAIKTLTGAAKNNAVLARIGGGAKVAGGGGIEAGKALLALYGPIGVSIAVGVVAVSGGIFIWRKWGTFIWRNKKIAEQVNKETNAIRIAEEKLIETRSAISHIHAETEELLDRVSEQFKRLEPLKDRNYAEVSDDEQSQIESLVKDTLALAEMLNKVVE